MEFKVPLSRADITQAEIDAVCAVLRSPTCRSAPNSPNSKRSWQTMSEPNSPSPSIQVQVDCFCA